MKYLDIYFVREHAEVYIAIATEHEFPQWRPWGISLWGWALGVLGQIEEGIAQIRQGLTGLQATGSGSGQTRCLTSLADVYRQARQPEDGLRMLAEAQAMTATTGMNSLESEHHWLRGELLLMLSGDEQAGAAACFHQAFAVTRRQQARSYELRAATSLARLWQQQDMDEAMTVACSSALAQFIRTRELRLAAIDYPGAAGFDQV